MASSVKSRRNHYQTLGLEVGATDAEIAEAFATESRKIIQNPRVNEPDVREKARQVRTAHQTLRDPAKRAAYDASLGLSAKESATAPEAAGEPSVRPFVAATRDEAKSDEHVAAAPSAAPHTGATARGRARRAEPDARTGLPEGMVVAAAAAAAAGMAKARAAPPRAPEEGLKREAADEAAAPPQPSAPQQAAPQPESAAEPAAETAYHFEDPGTGTTALYGERRERKLNRAAAGGIAAAAALALGAFWLWPAENSDRPGTAAEDQIAAEDMTQGIPDVLNGVAPEPGATDDPFEGTELADAGSYQSVTFADSGPIPESVAVPSSGAPLAEPAPAASAATPSAAGDARPSTVATTAPAPVAQTAASTPPAAASTAVAAAPARVQAAPDLRPATPPKLIRGSILNSDNRRGAYQGTVSVRFTVGTSGRATGCTPTASSGNFRLDAYTCELVQQRLQFTPAVTAQGRPVPAEMRATYNWGRKRRTLTGRLLDIVR